MRKNPQTLPETQADLERVALDALAGLVSLKLAQRGLTAGEVQRKIFDEPTNLDAGQDAGTKALHVVLGKIMYTWNRRSPYVDPAGRPRPLTASGPGLSLRGLVEEHADVSAVPQVLAALDNQGLIRRSHDGLLRPTGNVARLRSVGPEVASYVADTITRLLDTVLRNLNRESKDPPLIERSAIVRDLPDDLEREFIEFASEQGELFIETMNEWLESRRLAAPSTRRPDSKPLTAGVQVFSFVTAPNPAQPPRRAARGAGSSRRSSSGALT